jgi:hypothetical protein
METPNGKSSSPVRNALYRNLRNGKFEDVAAKAGVDRIPFYGMGVAAADFDNDGFPDLYVTGFPSSALFHNNGDGTFSDVTDQAGLKNAGRWAASAAWFDFDRDGLLDHRSQPTMRNFRLRTERSAKSMASGLIARKPPTRECHSRSFTTMETGILPTSAHLPDWQSLLGVPWAWWPST